MTPAQRKRRPNGEGSIRHRQDGRWEASAFATTNQGTRKRVYLYGRTRAEAREKLRPRPWRDDPGLELECRPLPTTLAGHRRQAEPSPEDVPGL